ncbi:MAG TPA: HAD-IB family phosphatase [Nocardioidaceae bacterium]|nr:HAD-IB family phosphatase [Nocardioidaceae bacterium]
MTVICVVDLDGTLIAENSFRQWIAFLGRWALRNRRVVMLLRLALACALRLLRIGSHATLKRRVLSLSTSVDALSVHEFSRQLASRVRPEVCALVAQQAQSGCLIVLVTAAPDFYLGPIGEALGADHVVASPSVVTRGWRELSGEAKLEALENRFGADVRLAVVLTDHADDAPLVRRAERTIVVAPDAGSWKTLSAAGTNVERLDPRPT